MIYNLKIKIINSIPRISISFDKMEPESCVNSLLFLSFLTILSSKLFNISNTVAFKKSTKNERDFKKSSGNEREKNKLIEYELLKSCEEIESTGVWSNSYIETDKVMAFYNMISKSMAIINDYNGMIFGGFVRDWIIRKDFNFKDIDVNFNSKDHIETFILALTDKYFVKIIDNVPVTIKNVENTTKFRICDHVKKT